jgi:hypothetical protein
LTRKKHHLQIKVGDLFLLYRYEDEPELLRITKKYMVGSEYKYFFHWIALIGGEEEDGVFWEDSDYAKAIIPAIKSEVIKIIFRVNR